MKVAGARRLAIVAALVALAACGESPPAAGTPSPSPRPTSLPPTAAVSLLKPMLHGLIDRDGPPTGAFRNVVTNFVVNVDWSAIQPNPGALVANNAIDQAIAQAQQMNAVPGHAPVGVKIRLYAGVYAPNWVKQLAGGPVNVVAGALSGTVGRFWTDAFGAAYADVWTRLARKYDTVPEIREITASRCMTFYAETFIRDAGDPLTVSNLLQAGFTVTADRGCIQQEIDLGSVWKQTRVGVAFNPYEVLAGDGVHDTDETFTAEMMQYCRAQLGPQCVLENNSIRTPLQAGLYAQMYSTMTTLGAPLSFQTATLTRIGDLTATIAWAVSVGANAVELPKGYTALPTSTLASLATALPASAV